VIANQKKNASFRTTLEYVLEKEGNEIIDSNMGGTTARELAKEFGAARRLRPNLKRACGHIILSIPHRQADHEKGEYHEHLDDEQYAEVGRRWLEGMGFLGEGLHQSQYAIARHHDTDHEHIHIIASRIRMDGSVVPDSWDYRRSEVVVRQLEKEYGLEATPCSSERVAQKVEREYGIEATFGDRQAPTQRQKHHESGLPSVKQMLADTIDAATEDNPTMTQLIGRLQHEGIEIHPQFSTRGKFKEAVAYEWHNVRVAGHQLGKAYSFPGLQRRRGVNYDPVRDLPALQAAAVGQTIELPAEQLTVIPIAQPDWPSVPEVEMPEIEDEQALAELTEDTLDQKSEDSMLANDELETTLIYEIQRQRAEEILAQAKILFKYVCRCRPQQVTEGENFTQVEGKEYVLLQRHEESGERVQSVIAKDGRGEIIRRRGSQLELVKNLDEAEVQKWQQAAAQANQVLERLEREMEAAKKKSRGFELE
jgi:hypothetical protein